MEKLIKAEFDDRLVKEYLIEFRGSQWSSTGTAKPHSEIWRHLVETLVITGGNAVRYPEGLDKGFRVPVSPLDGEREKKDPPLDPVIRYIAAIDLAADRFPRGRLMVNRAVARIVRGIRKRREGYEGPAPTARDVEYLRFLRNWTSLHPAKPLSSDTIQEACKWGFCDLLEPIDRTGKSLHELDYILEEWDDAFEQIIYSTDYLWLF